MVKIYTNKKIRRSRSYDLVLSRLFLKLSVYSRISEDTSVKTFSREGNLPMPSFLLSLLTLPMSDT